MTGFNGQNHDDFLIKQSEAIVSYFKARHFHGISMSFSGHFFELAPLFLCKNLAKHNLKVHLLFMPDMHTNASLFDLVNSLGPHFQLNLKIIPIKFLQSVYKNLIHDNLGIDLSSDSQEITLDGIRQTLLCALSEDQHLLYIDATTKTHFLTGKIPKLSIKNSLCPLGNLYQSEVYNLIIKAQLDTLNIFQTYFQDQMQDTQSIQQFDSLLDDYFIKKKPIHQITQNQQMIDKIIQLNNHSLLDQMNYFPII